MLIYGTVYKKTCSLSPELQRHQNKFKIKHKVSLYLVDRKPRICKKVYQCSPGFNAWLCGRFASTVDRRTQPGPASPMASSSVSTARVSTGLCSWAPRCFSLWRLYYRYLFHRWACQSVGFCYYSPKDYFVQPLSPVLRS